MLLFLLACGGDPGVEGDAPGECADGADNDGDFFADCADPDCAGVGDCEAADDTGGDDTGGGSVGPLYINEFMASNATAVADEDGAHPDWIEIYNGGDAAYDLDGLTITDDAADTEKHPLGALTVEAKGWLVLWADGDVDQGEDHLSFKLGKDGGYIGLFDAEGVALDRLEYAAQTTDWSAYRTPDGGKTWEFTDAPTPGEANP